MIETVSGERFNQSGNPEEWPEGITWGGDEPKGTGCYIVHGVSGQIQIKDGDIIVRECEVVKAFREVGA